jgi:hypothetical protein
MKQKNQLAIKNKNEIMTVKVSEKGSNHIAQNNSKVS